MSVRLASAAASRRAVPAPKLELGSRVLKAGMHGADVKQLQKYLNRLDPKHKVTPDGVFGPGTKKAVIRFQKSSNQFAKDVQDPGFAAGKADGVVGPKTVNAILYTISIGH